VDREEHGGNDARDQVVLRRRRTLVGHVHDVQARLQFQELHAEVVVRAVSRRAVVELAGLRLHPGDELRHRVDGHRFVHHEREAGRADVRDRGKLLHHVVGDLRIKMRRGDDRRGSDHDRVAVGRRLHHDIGADRPGGARPVLDEERLVPARLQPGREQPRHDVRPGRGRERNDDPHRTLESPWASAPNGATAAAAASAASTRRRMGRDFGSWNFSPRWGTRTATFLLRTALILYRRAPGNAVQKVGTSLVERPREGAPTQQLQGLGPLGHDVRNGVGDQFVASSYSISLTGVEKPSSMTKSSSRRLEASM